MPGLISLARLPKGNSRITGKPEVMAKLWRNRLVAWVQKECNEDLPI
jgi:hypothetical protein